MPLWRVFYPPGLYSPADKQALAAAITKIYTAISPTNLPAFYVNVVFIESSAEDIYVGGVPQTRFVRFAGEHIARHMKSDETARMNRFMTWFSEAVAPWTKDIGVRWEAHIAQSPAELWRVDGIIPPPANSETENLWRQMNAPVPYDDLSVTPSNAGAIHNSTSVNGVMAARA